MAQIDLMNLLKATSTTGASGSGANSAAKPAAAAGLFEQILTSQGSAETAAAPLALGGNGLPSGNSLPTNTMSMLHQTQSSEQLLATLSPKQQSNIDDLSFITQLQPVVDMPQTTVAAAVSQLADSKVNFSDQQLQDFAVQLGIDPAVAKLVLQSTAKPEAAAGALNVQAGIALGMGFKPGQAQAADAKSVPGTALKASVQEQPQVQVQPQTNLSQQKQASIGQSLDSLPLKDSDVIRVRNQQSAVPTNANTSASASANTAPLISTNVSAGGAPSVAIPVPQIVTQSFLQQRQARAVSQVSDKKTELANAINKVLTQPKTQAVSATGSNASSAYASIALAPSLVQKLDQFIGLTSSVTNTTNSLEPQGLGSYTGSNFKAAAPLANMPATVVAASSSEVSTMDLGQRFTSLMQGDSSAQVAARQMQDQMGQQLQRMVKEGRWQANLSLNPARLGQVSINLVMEDGVLQTQLISGNAGVRELLESSLPRLREQLEDSGLQLANVSVGSESPGQQQSRGEAPDWQLSQTLRNASEPQVTTVATNVRSGHDGDVDTFA